MIAELRSSYLIGESHVCFKACQTWDWTGDSRVIWH